MKNKTMLYIAIALIIGLALGGYYWYSKSKEGGAEVITTTSGGNVLPSVSTNPLENNPNINPADQTNPFKKIKTNPFE